MTTSASTSSCASSLQSREWPPVCSASARARSGERFVTRMRSAPSEASALAESAPILPAPTRRTARPFRSPKIFATSSTATCETELAPRPISVSLRTRLAVAKARLHRREMNAPAAWAELARP